MRKYLDCKKVDTAIDRAKKMLIKKAEEKGVYENFGRREVMEIKDKFVNLCDYSREMNTVRNKIDCFDNWCGSYTGR